MNEFQLYLLIAAIIVAITSWRLPRSRLWIAAGAVSFVASTAWWRYGMPYPPAFTLSLDALVCLLIYFFGRERWEERIYQIFQLSVLVSLIYLAGPIDIAAWHVSTAFLLAGHVGFRLLLRRPALEISSLSAAIALSAVFSWTAIGWIEPITVHMDHWLYVFMLEICNWLALAIIGGTAFFDWIKAHESDADHTRSLHLRHAGASWRKVRSAPPFHKVTSKVPK